MISSVDINCKQIWTRIVRHTWPCTLLSRFQKPLTVVHSTFGWMGIPTNQIGHQIWMPQLQKQPPKSGALRSCYLLLDLIVDILNFQVGIVFLSVNINKVYIYMRKIVGTRMFSPLVALQQSCFRVDGTRHRTHKLGCKMDVVTSETD